VLVGLSVLKFSNLKDGPQLPKTSQYLLFVAVFTTLSCGAPLVEVDAGTDGGRTGDGGSGAGNGSDGGFGGGSGSDGGNVRTDAGDVARPPVVTSTSPASDAGSVVLNARISATFSTSMNPATLTDTTFTVKAGTNAVTGAVSTVGSAVFFTPAANLTAGTTYEATIGVGAKSAAGLALAAPYRWTFATGSAVGLGPAPVVLGSAGNFVVLAKAAISTVPPSVLTGNIGVSPAAATLITEFALVADSTNIFSTSTQVVGKVYASNYAVPTPSNLTTAVSNMESAYTDAAGRPPPNQLNLGTGAIGGLTLTPGLYKWTSSVTILSDLVISGDENAVWIFQITGDLTLASAKRVTLTGDALAKNIFWVVAGQATFGARSHFEGVLLSQTAITLETGATMNGRALAQTQVALQQATITQPAP